MNIYLKFRKCIDIKNNDKNIIERYKMICGIVCYYNIFIDVLIYFLIMSADMYFIVKLRNCTNFLSLQKLVNVIYYFWIET